MSWHERAAYIFGFAAGDAFNIVHPWWLTAIILLALGVFAAAVSLYLDKKEPFAEAMR